MRILLAFLAVHCAAAFSPGAEIPSRPNIVLILADDLGWTDLGCQGSKYYETPNIDRLAREGMRLTSFYVSQNCAPTRAALISGQYAPRTGVYTVNTLERGRAADRRMDVPRNETKLPLDKITIADVLQRAGYATGMFGKWHLGPQGEYHPGRRGFEEAIVSNGRHFNFRTHPPVDVPDGACLGDFLTDRAVDFIERHRQERFFLYLAHFAVHSPYQAKPELVEKYRDKPPAGGHRDPVYAAMIHSVDESVGRVLGALSEFGLAENTLVIFSSDNGGVGGYYSSEPPSEKRGITDNAPLRGGKGTLYEGGIRVPFIARWPAVVQAGTICDEPAVHVDLYPTFLELAGGRPEPDCPLDGVSLAPILKDPSADLDRDAIYWHFPGYLQSYVHKRGWRTPPVGVIRAGDYKLLEFFEDGRLELYNLAEDLSERRNLAETMPEKAAGLRSMLAAWRTRLDAPMPQLKAR